MKFRVTKGEHIGKIGTLVYESGYSAVLQLESGEEIGVMKDCIEPAAIDFKPLVRHLDAETKEWMDAAARGDAPWVCSDCGATCPNGTPVDCVYWHPRCTDILKRDREHAALSSSSDSAA